MGTHRDGTPRDESAAHWTAADPGPAEPASSVPLPLSRFLCPASSVPLLLPRFFCHASSSGDRFANAGRSTCGSLITCTALRRRRWELTKRPPLARQLLSIRSRHERPLLSHPCRATHPFRLTLPYLPTYVSRSPTGPFEGFRGDRKKNDFARPPHASDGDPVECAERSSRGEPGTTGRRAFFVDSGIAGCARISIVARFVSLDPRR